VQRSTNKNLNSHLAFLIALCFVIALPISLAAWLTQAHGSAADAAPATSQSTVAVNPPAGMSGDPVAQPVNPPPDPTTAAMISRGEYLAVAGDCQYCHSIPGGTPYAGGQPVQTPFGDLFTPNITPDKTFGIGNYTDAQFWNVMHNGIAPGHSLLVFPNYLYPVMPWQDYNKLSYSDVMAIKAYLDSIQPVPQPNRPSEMNFPFTLRAGLLAWRLLYFNDQPIQYDPSWSPQVRNGAFIVQALAHCGECHTQRNLLMAVEQSRSLGGGGLLAQSWHAPNISSANGSGGVGSWAPGDLQDYLYRGGAVGIGAPYGPMKAVVDDSLSRLPASDIQDIVAYLQTATPAKSSVAPGAAVDPASDGAQVYADNCARCHGANGEGITNNFPNLANNQSIWDGPADNLISMVLGGYAPWHPNQSSMPAFAQSLTDSQIAAVANYIRTSWGNKGAADATGAQVAALRGLASDWVDLSTGTVQAGLQGEDFDDISGNLELFGDRENCMLNANLTNSDHSVYLVGSCGNEGGAFVGNITVDGKSSPVTLLMRLTGSGGHFDTMTLSGPVPGGQNFDARIALAAAND
jgi:cbb3-type cytochrome c oxidase subunit III